MGIGSSTSGISFSGIGTGIDATSIVERLMSIERIPIRRMQAQQQQIQAKQSTYSQLRTLLNNVRSAATAINSAEAFNPLKATSSDTAVATVSVGTGAVGGSYGLAVSYLATAQKAISSALADTTSSMSTLVPGYTGGQFTLNGKIVNITASDTITQVAQRINDVNSGVTASVINGGAGNVYLSLTANQTGAVNAIQLADISGGTLGSLGLVSGATGVREADGADAMRSYKFSSTSTAVATMMGQSTGPSGTVTINGQSVSINYTADSLQAIVDRINGTAGINATASIVTTTTNGVTTSQIKLQGAAGMPTITDTNSLFAGLGFLQRTSSDLVGAGDAYFSVDGVNLSSTTNTVTSVIPGVTLNLLAADAVTPKTSTINVTRDSEAVKKKLRDFTEAYNKLSDFIKQQSSFNKDTFATGALFGDFVSDQALNSVASTLFKDVNNLTTSFKNLTQFGFTFTDQGKLSFDESKFDSAMSTDPVGVSNVFRAFGSTNLSTLSFVSSTQKTKASVADGYDVAITTIATKGKMVSATTGPDGTNPADETLTFSGALIGSTNYTLTVGRTLTQAQVINLINNDTKLKDLVTASSDGSGKLVIESKKFGTVGNFTVVSNQVAAANNTGIGTGAAGSGTYTTGVDIAGTINGEAATGSGQFLTGNTGNANTEGLQIQYTGATTGTVGKVKFSRGIADQVYKATDEYLDSLTGALTAADKSLENQIKDIDSSIKATEERLKVREQTLRKRFLEMERLISQFQQQQSRLGAVTSQLQSLSGQRRS